MWFFGMLCKLFGRRAADEHKNLEVPQFIIGDDETGLLARAAKTGKEV